MSSKTKVLELSIQSFLDRVLSLPDLRDRVILQILFETGCCINELCAIRVSDYIQPKNYIDFNEIRFSGRKAVISETLGIAIRKYILFRQRHGNDYLFSQQADKPMSSKRIEQLVDSIFDGKLRPIHIRYMHILHAASKGLSPDTICDQTGLLRQRVLQILDQYNVAYHQSYSLFFEEYGGKNDRDK